MNHSEIKYQIFISSTYEDLKEERAAAVETVLKRRHFPVGMEMFGARNQDQWQVIKSTIDSSDIYILIIGHRYGSIDKSESPQISYTEKEFNYALSKREENKMIILCFIRERDVKIEVNKIEHTTTGQRKLERLIRKIKNAGITVDFWKHKDDLANNVGSAISNAISDLNLNNNENVGWVKRQSLTSVINNHDSIVSSPLIGYLPEVQKHLESSALDFEIENDDTEIYEFTEEGHCTITRNRIQLCKSNVTYSVCQFVADKKGQSKILNIYDISNTRSINPVILSNNYIELKFILFFGRVIEKDQSINYSQIVYIENYLSNLIDGYFGTIRFLGFPKTSFKNKTDVFIFPDIEVFENLIVTLKQTYPNMPVNNIVSCEIKNGKKYFTYKHGAITVNSDIIIEFSRK